MLYISDLSSKLISSQITALEHTPIWSDAKSLAEYVYVPISSSHRIDGIVDKNVSDAVTQNPYGAGKSYPSQ